MGFRRGGRPSTSSRKLKASSHSSGPARRLFSRWQGTMRSKGHSATSSRKRATFWTSRLSSRHCRMGATSRPPPAFMASKEGRSSRVQAKGYRPPHPSSFMGEARASRRAWPRGTVSSAEGWKKSANCCRCRQPLARTAGVSATTSSAASRAWKSSARGSLATIAGILSETRTTTSVTSRVLVGAWKKAASPKPPILSLLSRGPTTR
mmetsp:Transcript_508/g.577  ORF Transcript_508/g.577 Transcript_508/m.577 type:complete len:207 (+) Transcript_508:405-1025(+)